MANRGWGDDGPTEGGSKSMAISVTLIGWGSWFPGAAMRETSSAGRVVKARGCRGVEDGGGIPSVGKDMRRWGEGEGK